jgi:hypothetical protein
MAKGTSAPRIYAAHPMTTYGSPREAKALARIAALAPGAEIVDPANRYRDTAHWRRDWPELVPRLSAVLVFGDSHGAVGTGCVHELADAWRLGVPVAMLDGRGTCRQLIGLRILSERRRNAWRAAVLVPGRPMHHVLLVKKAS